MTVFTGHIIGKIDAKGRVLVPASFRAAVAAQNRQLSPRPDADGVFVYPSFDTAAIEGGGNLLEKDLNDVLDAQLGRYSHQREAMGARIYARGGFISYDKEGRLNLPDAILAHAQIEKELCFVGFGSRFQIWRPDLYQTHEQALFDDISAAQARDILNKGIRNE